MTLQDHRPHQRGLHPFLSFLLWTALTVLVFGSAVLTGIAVASLITGGVFVWPGNLPASWDTLRALPAHLSNPAGAYPAHLAGDVAGPPAAWAGAVVVVLAMAAGAWWSAVHLMARRFDPRRHIEKHETRRQAERQSSSAWARPTDPQIQALADDGDPMRWPLGWLGGIGLAGPRFESLIVKAPTGSGKTARFVVRMILRLCRAQVPKVITSVKMDAQALTIAAARRSGPVWAFMPGNTGSARWAAFAGCGTMAGARTTAAWLSKSQRTESVTGDNMRFWEELGQKLLTPLLYASFRSGKGISFMVRCVELTAESKITELLEKILDDAHGTPEEADARKALSMWLATCGREARAKSSVFSTAEVILSGFDHPEVAALITTDDHDPDIYSPANLIDGRGTLYITAIRTRVEAYGGVFDAMMAQLLYEVETRSDAAGGLPIPTGIALILEEAANIATPARLPYVASAMRAMGLLLASFWQDDGQIEKAFGAATARTVNSNHAWKVWLPRTTDDQTLKALSDRIGTYSRIDTTFSDNRGGGGESNRYTDVPAATVADLQKLHPDEAVIIGADAKPIRATTKAWFDDPDLRSQIPADVAASFDQAFAPKPATPTWEK